MPDKRPACLPGAIDDAAPQRLSEVLAEIANDATRERISVAHLLTALEDRALGALLFIFALPNVLPAPPGTSAVLGAPLIFLSAQLALGMRPWLPAMIASRSVARKDFQAILKRAMPWLRRGEALLTPRLSLLSSHAAERVTGAVCFVLAVVLFLPIPFGNMLPALAICLLALGVLERDGIWIVGGMAASVLSATLVWGIVYAVIQAALYIIARAV